MQMGSFFVEQGTQMDRQMFGGNIQIPAASLALFNTISIIALIPVYDRVLVPGLRYFGKKISLLQRIGRLTSCVKCTCTPVFHKAPASLASHSACCWLSAKLRA